MNRNTLLFFFCTTLSSMTMPASSQTILTKYSEKRLIEMYDSDRQKYGSSLPVPEEVKNIALVSCNVPRQTNVSCGYRTLAFVYAIKTCNDNNRTPTSTHVNQYIDDFMDKNEYTEKEGYLLQMVTNLNKDEPEDILFANIAEKNDLENVYSLTYANNVAPSLAVTENWQIGEQSKRALDISSILNKELKGKAVTLHFCLNTGGHWVGLSFSNGVFYCADSLGFNLAYCRKIIPLVRELNYLLSNRSEQVYQTISELYATEIAQEEKMLIEKQITSDFKLASQLVRHDLYIARWGTAIGSLVAWWNTK